MYTKVRRSMQAIKGTYQTKAKVYLCSTYLKSLTGLYLESNPRLV